MKIVTIKTAMQYVADNPVMRSDDMLGLPAHELVVRTLFEIANSPSESPGSKAAANAARGMIFNRMVGRRKPGSHPATHKKVEIEFVDLTGGEIEA